MGKGNDYREPRKRGFDDDYQPPSDFRSRPSTAFGQAPRPAFGQAPRPSRPGGPEATGPEVEATVKWFKADKGFGFVELSTGGDAFLHASVLTPAGYEEVAAGNKLKVQVGQGQKGMQVTRVIEVDATASAPVSRPAQRPAYGDRPSYGERPARPQRPQVDMANARSIQGVVKWFNGEKGFGFIADPDGGKDIFVHISVLQAAGLAHLDENQSVSVKVVDTPKGREAVSVAP